MFNASVSDNMNISSCWLTLDGGANKVMSLNATLTMANYSMSGIGEGNHLVRYYCNDTSTWINSTTTTNFTVDITNASLSYGSGTEANASTMPRDWIYVNVSAIDGITGVININFTLWNSSGMMLVNRTTGATRDFNWTRLNSSLTYYYNVTACDYAANCQNLGARTITLAMILVDLNSPANTTYTNGNYTNFTCSVNSSSQYVLTNVTFFLWNASSSNTYNLTANISVASTTNISIFNYTFVKDGVYTWNCMVRANNTVIISATSNRTLTFDTTSPVVTHLTPADGTAGAAGATSMAFTYNVTDTNPVTCTLYVGGASKGSDASANYTGGANTLTASSLSAGSYSGKVTCVDGAGNSASTSLVSFTITAAGATSSSGGTTSSIALSLTPTDMQNGVSKNVLKGWRLKFKTANAQDHEIGVGDIANGKVSITVSSTPQTASLSVGEEKKFELTGDNNYDLSVKLNSINGNIASLAVKQISEAMPAAQQAGTQRTATGAGEQVAGSSAQTGGSSTTWVIIGIIVLVVIAVVIVLAIVMGKKKR